MPRSFFGMTSLTPPCSLQGSSPSRSRTPSPSPLNNLRLRVSAGPSYDRTTHVNVNVNDPNEPTLIQSQHFMGHLVVRVQDYAGVPGENGIIIKEDEDYFSETNDTCSIMFGGWFNSGERQLNVNDIVFGVFPPENVFD